MSKAGRDSPEVIKFLTLFERLKLFVDDIPEDLRALAAGDTIVKTLCVELSIATLPFHMHSLVGRNMFAAPVEPKFLHAWRDYEERYEEVVSDISFSDIFSELPLGESSNVSRVDILWENADIQAAEEARNVAEVIDFVRFRIDQEDQSTKEQTDFVDRIEDGLFTWDRLEGDIGFDVRGVLRRRALIPFVLIPRRVATRYGGGEKLSLLASLRQVHDAFIFGTPYAALALMRSIMEVVLRDHYHAEGSDLSERVRNVRRRLPPRANEAALHRLRKLANAILHFEREKDEGLPKMDEVRLEKEILSLLLVLRALIEGVK